MTSWLWGCKSKLGGLPRTSTWHSLVILFVSLLDSITPRTMFLPEEFLLSWSFFCTTGSVTLALDSKLLFLASWLLMVIEVDDLCWPAGNRSSFDSPEGCRTDITVLFWVSGLVAGVFMAAVVVVTGVWGPVIVLHMDEVVDFWSWTRPLLLCSAVVAAAVFGRSLLEDLLQLAER